jgi:hypothetical protein
VLREAATSRSDVSARVANPVDDDATRRYVYNFDLIQNYSESLVVRSRVLSHRTAAKIDSQAISDQKTAPRYLHLIRDPRTVSPPQTLSRATAPDKRVSSRQAFSDRAR